jgi:hypothetical protein
MNAVQNRRSWHAGWNDGFHGRPYGTSLLAIIDALGLCQRLYRWQGCVIEG